MNPLYIRLNLGYSAGVFQALQLNLLVAFGAVDKPLASCMMVHFMFMFLKWQLVCKFRIVEGNSLLWRLGSLMVHLPDVWWSIFRFRFWKWQLVCKFGIVEGNFLSISCLCSCFCTLPNFCLLFFLSILFYSGIVSCFTLSTVFHIP